ncbi:MAG: hypothetical protein SP1CHLAM54_01480 [Chlamydiia bacterium]|nr:hypothetical protein [Chlamydiia bacterium]MCH9615067.1 hypothetical protein [Chlamydiia bacterium]MCH9628611.1 hypothetical protein [Chlamydiia bacterium]
MYERNLELLSEKNPLLAMQVRMSGAVVPKDVDVLFVYGCGDVGFEGKHLIYLEDDLDRLSRFMESKAAGRLLEDPRVEFHFLSEEVLKGLLWRFCFKKSVLVANKGDHFQELKAKFEELKEGIFLVASDYRDFGLRVVDNVLKNVRLKMRDGLKVIMGGPAIIVGAGPSLDGAREDLMRLSKGALVLAAGSSVGLVDMAHAAVAFDPDPSLQEGKGRPLFFQNRLSHRFLKGWNGPKFNMGSSGGHPVEEYLMGSGRFFDGGWNVANFAAKVALNLGCSPIILVGVDLQGSGYAKGILGSKSTAEFNLAAKYFEDLAIENPETEWLNASDGGRALKGFDKVRLNELHFVEKETIFPEEKPLDWAGDPEVFLESLKRCQSAVSHLLKGPNALYEVELEEEVAFTVFLNPLWEVWRHFIDDRWIFFGRVLDEALLRFG